jgi:hypothetical protein
VFAVLPVVLDDLWCANVGLWFPSVVARRIAFPFDQIFQRLPAAVVAVLFDTLDFELLFSINQLWRRSGIVRSVCLGFVIGAQE